MTYATKVSSQLPKLKNDLKTHTTRYLKEKHESFDINIKVSKLENKQYNRVV